MKHELDILSNASISPSMSVYLYGIIVVHQWRDFSVITYDPCENVYTH